MAKPIQLDFPPRNLEKERKQLLTDASLEHAEALNDLLDLAETLRRHNVLNTVQGLVGAGGSLTNHLAAAAARPESVRALRNLIALTRILGSLDPELIESVGKAIPPSWKDRNAREEATAPSLWKVGKALVSPGARRALYGAAMVLAGVGIYMSRNR